MTFLAISKGAAESLASDRFLQSCEFGPGMQLASFLLDLRGPIPDVPRVYIDRTEAGVCVVGRGEDFPDSLIVDVAQARLFDSLSESDALLVLQKLLRFAIRYWASQKLSSHERILKGTTRAVVFPFPISTQSSFRVVVETAPDTRRMARRPALGRCLLVYAAGTDDKCGAVEPVPVAALRAGIEAIGGARRDASTRRATPGSAEISPIGLTRLSPLPHLIDGNIGFDAWERNLTAAQKAFVAAPLVGPHRIEGPAGSGKTICLVLKVIHAARLAQAEGREHRSLFLAHSDATRHSILNLFRANDSDGFSERDEYSSPQSVRVTTLHELCGRLLGTEISASEFLDRDALESKNTQLLYVDEVLSEALEKDLETHKKFLSREFQEFLEQEDRWKVALMLRHEISVVIKGRAQESLTAYRQIPRVLAGLPLLNDADRGFVFVVFQKYQERLKRAAVFDTDDVVLSALGQLNTPIWRRRRRREGYDGISVDETHLFNLNELSVLHHLTRTDTSFPIAYSTDPAQSLEDRGWSDQVFDEALSAGVTVGATTTRMKAVFRCSSDITNLALSVTTAGATLFANFDNSLREAMSTFTEVDERQSASPVYVPCAGDDEMIRVAFKRAEDMAAALDGGKAKVAIIVFDEALLAAARHFASEANKPVELLSRRGDIEVLQRAARSGRFVLASPDYVGGLEFSGVVLVGVDRGRVPPTGLGAQAASTAFLAYQAHSRLYVSLTRARFRVEVLGTLQRGPSDLLKVAFDRGAIAEETHGAADPS